MMAKDNAHVAKIYGTIILITIIGSFAIALYVFSSYGGASLHQQQIVVNVSGSYSINLAPNTASAYIAIESTNMSANSSQTHNIAKVNGVIAAVEALGVSKSQIQTTYYSVQPSYTYINGTYVDQGYEAVQDLNISTNSSSLISMVVAAAISAGGNGTSVSQVSFGLTNALQQKAQSEAVAGAVLNARSKVQAIANATGTQVDRLISVSNVQSSSICSIYCPVYLTAAANGGSGAPSIPQLTASNVTVSAQVQAVYTLT
jgi:uncharacterized protein